MNAKKRNLPVLLCRIVTPTSKEISVVSSIFCGLLTNPEFYLDLSIEISTRALTIDLMCTLQMFTGIYGYFTGKSEWGISNLWGLHVTHNPCNFWNKYFFVDFYYLLFFMIFFQISLQFYQGFQATSNLRKFHTHVMGYPVQHRDFLYFL